MHDMVDKNEASWLGQLRRGVADCCVLAVLEQREWYGLVDTVWRESTEGPPRRYYALTPTGADALVQFRAQWTQFTRAMNELMDHAKAVSSE